MNFYTWLCPIINQELDYFKFRDKQRNICQGSSQKMYFIGSLFYSKNFFRKGRKIFNFQQVRKLIVLMVGNLQANILHSDRLVLRFKKAS